MHKTKASEMNILRCMGSIFFLILKVLFEISHKILNPYTAKYARYEMLKIW